MMKSLLLCLLAFGCTTGVAQDPKPTGADLIRKKLETIRIPEIAYDGLTMAEAVNDLLHYSKRQDLEKQGVNMQIKPEVNQVLVNIKLPLFNLNLKQSLDAIVRTADVQIRYVVENHAIVFERDNGSHPPVKTAGQAARLIHKKLQQIKIPVVHYDRLTFDEVIMDLMSQTREHRINFVMAPTRPIPGTEPVPITAPVLDAFGNPIVVPGTIVPARGPRSPDLSMVIIRIHPALRDVTLKETLDAMVKTASVPIRYTVEDYGVVFEIPPPEKKIYLTQLVKVVPDRVWAKVNELSGGIAPFDSNTTSKRLRAVLLKKGISSMSNKGTRIFINVENGQILIRAIKEDLPRIKEVISQLNTP